jgi:hypothetical protein
MPSFDWRTGLWEQFGSSISMLENALEACPDELWSYEISSDPSAPPGFSQLWYVGYHALLYLDLYLSGEMKGFAPPAPFSSRELDTAAGLPDRPYHKEELLAYLDYCFNKGRATIQALTDEKAGERCGIPWLDLSYFELHLYNMRHVQEHAGQLGLVLGQKGIEVSHWVSRVEKRPMTS